MPALREKLGAEEAKPLELVDTISKSEVLSLCQPVVSIAGSPTGTGASSAASGTGSKCAGDSAGGGATVPLPVIAPTALTSLGECDLCSGCHRNQVSENLLQSNSPAALAMHACTATGRGLWRIELHCHSVTAATWLFVLAFHSIALVNCQSCLECVRSQIFGRLRLWSQRICALWPASRGSYLCNTHSGEVVVYGCPAVSITKIIIEDMHLRCITLLAA